MPEPNERKIEKLLQAAGAKRREQAGTPELHPATREILQTEIRRYYGPAPKVAKSEFRWVFALLPKVVVFIALGACAWLMWFRDTGDKPTRLAMDQEAASRPLIDEERLRSSKTLPVPAEAPAKPGFDVSGETKEQPEEMSSATMSPSPEPPAAELAHSAVPVQASPKSVVGAEYFKADRQAMYMGTAATESEEKATLPSDKSGVLAALRESEHSRKRADSKSKTSPDGAVVETAVLQNFTVFNEGNVVRFVDADGSTYVGRIRLAKEHAASPTPLSTVTLADSMAPTGAKSSSVDSVSGVVLLNYSVSASGTNRSLGQTVRFEGNLELTKAQVELGRNVFSNTILPVAGRKAEAVFVPERQFTTGRLQGSAVLGDGKDVRVDAIPATP